jgi:hypothetical protein
MIEGQLNDLGLECRRAGRQFAAQATNADLLIVDLFLGSAQQAIWNHLDPGPLACVADRDGVSDRQGRLRREADFLSRSRKDGG